MNVRNGDIDQTHTEHERGSAEDRRENTREGGGDKGRDEALDILKGIGILSVIAWHSIHVSPVYYFISSYHMPLFFVVGGYLFKKSDSLLGRIRKDYGRLIAPYLAVSLLYLLFPPAGETIIYVVKSVIWSRGSTSISQYWWADIAGAIGVVWFLTAMFWCRTAYNMIARKTEANHKIWAVGTAIVATLVDRYVINLPLGFCQGLGAMTFFAIGETLREQRQEIERRENKRKAVGWLVGGMACWAVGIAYDIFVHHSSFSLGSNQYHLYPIEVAGGAAMTVVLYLLSRWLKGFKTGKFLGWCGKTSMLILCIHAVSLHYGLRGYLDTVMTKNMYGIGYAVCDILFSCALAFLLSRLRPVGRFFGV